MLKLTAGITDKNLTEIYDDPYIQRVGHDHRAASPVFHPAVTYLSAWIDDEFVGAFLSVRFTQIEFELHSLLTKKALPASRELGRMFLSWAFSHPIERVTAYVIQGLESAKNYCLKLGFVYEGMRRNACMKNGELKGIHILGMTRIEWESL